MSHLHLAPTLLEILGAEAPSSFRGGVCGQTYSEASPGMIPRSALRSSSAGTVARIPFEQKAGAYRGCWRFAKNASRWSCGLSPTPSKRCTTWKRTQLRPIGAALGLRPELENGCCWLPATTWRKRLRPTMTRCGCARGCAIFVPIDWARIGIAQIL